MSGFPAKFMSWTQEELFPGRQAHLDEILSSDEGYYITGAVGCGKTAFITVLGKELSRRSTTTVHFRNLPRLFFEIRGSYNDALKASEYSLITALIQPEILILDDIGAEKVNENVRDDLCTLLNERIWNGRRTFFTSNLSIAQIGERTCDRIASRIAELTGGGRNVIVLGNTDLRVGRNKT